MVHARTGDSHDHARPQPRPGAPARPPSPHARLVALQRAAGNTVVARMVTEERLADFESALRPLLAEGAPAPERLDRLITTLLADAPPDRRATLLNDARRLVDRSTGYGDAAVNAALDAVDRHDPQRSTRAVPGSRRLSPSRVTGEVGAGVINRGPQESVLVGGEFHVPVYVAVFEDALGSGAPRNKDVGQDQGGHVQIHTGAASGPERVMWLSLGQALRQLKWMDKYGEQSPAARPLIRSFLVPESIVNRIAAGLITEHGAKDSSRDLNVDKRFAANQVGIRDPRSLEALRQNVLPGSLRTYTDLIGPAPRTWGDTRPANELRLREGVPTERLRDFPVDADPSGFVGYEVQVSRRDRLDEVARAHADTPEGGRNELVERFYAAHAPKRFTELDARRPDEHHLAVHAFVQQLVLPWRDYVGRNLRITDDYAELGQGELPEDPTMIEIAGEQPLTTGERRTGVAGQAEEQWTELRKRAAVRGALERMTIGRAEFAEAGKTPGLPQLLGEVTRFRGAVLADYRHRVGDLETVRRLNPRHAETALRLVERFPRPLPRWGRPIVAGLARVVASVGGTVLAKVRARKWESGRRE
ncbi:hypothetical protein [Actinosynnema pretiosum]|uniref:hypothetical protein n=1 Tax=Actinosynnema pretiosum TaxID=42197 RepID=UPI0012FD6B2B|nr:hypothetical protein [Actinosynnema pretiosum]